MRAEPKTALKRTPLLTCLDLDVEGGISHAAPLVDHRPDHAHRHNRLGRPQVRVGKAIRLRGELRCLRKGLLGENGIGNRGCRHQRGAEEGHQADLKVKHEQHARKDNRPRRIDGCECPLSGSELPEAVEIPKRLTSRCGGSAGAPFDEGRQNPVSQQPIHADRRSNEQSAAGPLKDGFEDQSDDQANREGNQRFDASRCQTPGHRPGT